jgi:hypothetical protein
MLIKSHQHSLKLLQSAYDDLDNARVVIASGKSTAIINHEIKNHLFSIIYYIEKILAVSSISEQVRSMGKMALSTINELLYLNYDLLDMTKKRLIDSLPKIEITSIINNCIQTSFSKERSMITFEYTEKECLMYGEERRVSDAFYKLISLLFQNYKKIRINFLKDSYVFLLTFTGSIPLRTQEQKLSKNSNFILSSIRSLFESYGGNVTPVKNDVFESIEAVYITIPNYIETPTLQDKEKDQIVLIKEGLENVDKIAQVFRNVFVNPHVFGNYEEIDKKVDLEHCKIIGTLKYIHTIKQQHPGCECFTLSNSPVSGLYITRYGENNFEHFSESFVLNNLLQPRY